MPPKRTVEETETWTPLASLGRTPLDGLTKENVEAIFESAFGIKFPGWTNRGRGHYSTSGIWLGHKIHLNYSDKTKKVWIQGRSHEAVYHKMLEERSKGLE